MSRTCSKFLSCASCCLCLVAAHAAAQQNYPARPIQIVVPFAAGGSIDITMRIIGPGLSELLGQPVVIVNRPGGGATIGMSAVARATPDGHTLGAASFTFAVNPFVLGDRMPYDSLKDFEPVTMIARSPMLMLVNAQMPAKTVQEFITYARARPGELNYGSVGIASSGHLVAALFESLAGIRMTHVPITSGPLPALLANQIHLQFNPIPSALPYVRTGRLMALGVTSLGAEPFAPGIPPLSETVPGFESYEWPGLVVRAGTPREIINRLHQTVVRVLGNPEVKVRLEGVGSHPAGSTPAEFGAFIRKEMATWEKVSREIRAREARGG